MNKHFLLLFIFLIVSQKTQAQSFVNPDLEGDTSTTSSIPYNWHNVPASDVNCQATIDNLNDTPDITGFTFPVLSYGIIGNPYSGSTFVSGLHARYFQTEYFHEGIMQTVAGFVAGYNYEICFHQSVVKQLNALDPSGSWSVYLDNTLVGTTLPTYSGGPYNSTSLTWELRTLTFTATASTHTIKFLPLDDDLDLELSETDGNGALRMGIDSIGLKSLFNLESHKTLCEGETVTLNATQAGATYLWQDNSNLSTFLVTETGTYWVASTINNVTHTDTIKVQINPRPHIDLGNDTTLCTLDSLTLDATTPGATYIWQDNSTQPTLTLTQKGIYSVKVTLGNCSAIDSITVHQKTCKAILTLPNLFTPNNDGLNDLFTPIESEGIRSMQTSIYNRWGSQVFETNALLIEWNAERDAAGVYYWTVHYTDTNGRENERNGYVLLVK